MATGTLEGTTIASRYKSLLKLTGTGNDVLAADASAKVVEDGDGNDSALALSTTRVGIGTTAPDRLLHLYAANSGVTPHANTNLFIEDSANNYLELGVPNGETAGIYFSDVASTSGSINYNHGSNLMTFSTDSLFNFAGGNVGIGESSPDTLLHTKTSSTTTNRLSVESNAEFLQVFVEDADLTGIMFKDGADLQIGQGSDLTGSGWDARVTIKDGGNVGIGITSPSAPLQIAHDAGDTNPAVIIRDATMADTDYQTINFGRDSSNHEELQIRYTFGTGGSNQSSYASFGLKGNEDSLNVSGYGYVGVKYATPIFPFHIQASGNIHRGGLADGSTIAYENAIGIAGDSGALATTSVIQLGDNDNTSSRQWAISNGWFADGSGTGQQHAGNLYITARSAVNLDPLSANSPGTTAFTFDRVDYFGIGTADPAYALHIKSGHGTDDQTTGGGTLALQGSDTTVSADTDLGTIYFLGSDADLSSPPAVGAKIMAEATGVWDSGSANDAPTALKFFTCDDDTSNTIAQRMVIRHNGYIGINKLVPTSLVHIKQPSSALSATVHALHVESAGGIDNGDVLVRLDFGEDDADVYTTNLGKFISFHDADGEIGYIAAASASAINTSIVASDVRLKSDIKDTSLEGLKIINAIKMRDFKWNDKAKKNARGTQEINRWIADEVYEVYPNATMGKPGATMDDGSIDPMGVAENQFISVMMKAIQELSAKVTALENK